MKKTIGKKAAGEKTTSLRKLKTEIKRLNKSYEYASGIEALFFVVDDIGVKLYDNKKCADFAYTTQRLASEHYLGPRVFSRINVKGVGFGFLTEVADTSEFYDWDEDSEECDDLRDELYKIGIDHGDLHEDNVGTIEGRLVCIDFGPISAS